MGYQAPQPQTAVVVFLDQYALAIKKEEPVQRVAPKTHVMQAPTARTWAQALGEQMEVEEAPEVPPPAQGPQHEVPTEPILAPPNQARADRA